MTTVQARGIFNSRSRSKTVAVPAGPPPLTGVDCGESGVVFARRLGGGRACLQQGPWMLLSPASLCRHVLVLGATGAGKTETVLRLAWTVAKTTDVPVYYMDGKGDRATAERFVGLMDDAGRTTRVFPNEPFDVWRGEPHEVHARLMEIIDYASDGPASWYRDLAKNTLRLACQQPDGPPRSSGKLLARMELGALRAVHPGSSAVAALTAEQVNQVRLRYEAFFGECRGQLDGTWAWEDTDAAYLLLDSLALGEETAGLARCLFADFAHFFSARKPREQVCLLIVDEFSSLAVGGGMASRIEQARGFNTGLVLCPQVVAGMGDELEAQRILGNVQTIICHRLNTPEDVVRLAGTRLVPEYSSHFDNQGATGEGSLRLQHQFLIDPNQLRSLPTGRAFVISHGRAAKAQILQAPTITAPLPDVELASNRMHFPKCPNSSGSMDAGIGQSGGLPAGEPPF